MTQFQAIAAFDTGDRLLTEVGFSKTIECIFDAALDERQTDRALQPDCGICRRVRRRLPPNQIVGPCRSRLWPRWPCSSSPHIVPGARSRRRLRLPLPAKSGLIPFGGNLTLRREPTAPSGRIFPQERANVAKPSGLGVILAENSLDQYKPFENFGATPRRGRRGIKFGGKFVGDLPHSLCEAAQGSTQAATNAAPDFIRAGGHWLCHCSAKPRATVLMRIVE